MPQPVIFDTYLDPDDYADADCYIDAALDAISDLVDGIIDPALLSAADALDLLAQLGSRVHNVRAAIVVTARCEPCRLGNHSDTNGTPGCAGGSCCCPCGSP